VHDNASQKGCTTLTERAGYSYVVSRRRNTTTYWRCSVRNRSNTCPATVTQNGATEFRRGQHKHNHAAAVGVDTAIPLVRSVKDAALQDVFQPASDIVDKQLKDVDLSQPCPALPPVANIIRIANRYRSTQRPKDPEDLSFVLDNEHLPADFLRADVTQHGQRHLVLASSECMRLLGLAKSWYIDGTFSVVGKPFKQLLSIHCFVKSGDCVKQLPLVYVLMSRRKAKDYVAVLSALRDCMSTCNVRCVTSDFERALWQAVASVFPGVEHHGCTFHWTQAVYRKIQALGLAVEYRENRSVYRLCRKLMSLPLVPQCEIPALFSHLKQQALTDALRRLFDYVDSTWVHTDVWPPSSWSAFRRPIRTNNDVEGWHYRLNRRARSCHLSLYVLIRLLHDETVVSSKQLKLVTDRKLSRSQKKKYRELHSKLYNLWEEYEAGSKSARKLLSACAFIYGPCE